MSISRTRTKQASSLRQYLEEIGQTPLLTSEEEARLAIRIQEMNDEDARQLLMKANLRLVVSIAKQYAAPQDQDMLLDFIQEGNMGLMRAVDRFKPEFKTRFSTYGVYWIREAVLRALKARRLVRLPENVFDRVLAMQRTRSKLSQLLGRTPTSQETAAEMEASAQEVAELEGFSSDIVSLDRTVNVGNDEDTARLQDVLEDSDALSPLEVAHDSLNRTEVRKAVFGLPVREREIIDARFGLSGDAPQTLEEIGEGFGISRERVRQLQYVALERLRHRQHVSYMV